MAEAEEVYRRERIEPVDLERAYTARGDELGVAEVAGYARAGGSTRQSLERRSPMVEVDYLNGEIVALGRMHGVPCPVNERLRQIVNAMAAAHTPPGSLSAPDILAQLGH
jgi:ketopantoate reductase